MQVEPNRINRSFSRRERKAMVLSRLWQPRRNIPRHCERSEAIQNLFRGGSRDCFAALAMAKFVGPGESPTGTLRKFQDQRINGERRTRTRVDLLHGTVLL